MGIVSLGLAFGIGAVIGYRAGRQFLHQQNLGEALVANAISNHLHCSYVLLNNVTLASSTGTTQIDHILVMDTGIFVVETKHYTGWIFGGPYDAQWTQVIFKMKNRFQNPIRQNYGHTKALQALFTLGPDAFFPLVVFTGNAEFKTEVGPTVLKLSELIDYISADRPVLFDERKMSYIVGRIEMSRLRRSLETDEYHRSSVQRRIRSFKT